MEGTVLTEEHIRKAIEMLDKVEVPQTNHFDLTDYNDPEVLRYLWEGNLGTESSNVA